jgi:hypothetical protein
MVRFLQYLYLELDMHQADGIPIFNQLIQKTKYYEKAIFNASLCCFTFLLQ